MNPSDRLGAGAKGSSIDMKALKSHPFFKGSDFSNSDKHIPTISSLEDKFILKKYTDQYQDFYDAYKPTLSKEDSMASVESMDFKAVD